MPTISDFQPPSNHSSNGSSSADPIITFTPRAVQPDKVEHTTLDQVLELIRAGEHEFHFSGEKRTITTRCKVTAIREQCAKSGGGESGRCAVKAAKLELPIVSFGGKFSRRANDALIESSGLVCADLDVLDDIASARGLLEQDPKTRACFASPTGTGLKVVVQVVPAPKDNSEHKIAFDTVAAHLANLGLAASHDRGTSDISRACFLSFDPDIYKNANAEPIHWAPPTPPASAASARPSLSEDSSYRRLTKPEVRELLSAIPVPAKPNYDFWLRIVSAVGSDLDEADAVEVLKEWAPQESNGEYEAKLRNPLKLITAGTLIHYARLNGWNGTISDRHPPKARGLFEFAVPQSEDGQELLTRRFLCRGGGLLFVGPTGIGKSSFSMQSMILWAIGRDCFGIKPARPLKSLLIQAENDDGDLAEMRDGVVNGLTLSEAEIAEVRRNIVVHMQSVATGTDFIHHIVRPLVQEHAPDLVWIDPALSYLGGETSSQKDVGIFLRNNLNPVLQEFGCAAVIVHHTNKPPSGKEKPDWSGSDFAYLGSGSAEWANWARAVIALRGTKSPAAFALTLGKRGSRAGWIDDKGEKTYEKFISHWKSAGTICWVEASEADIPETKGGRPRKHEIGDIIRVFEAGMGTTDWQKAADSEAGISKSTFHALKKEAIAVGRIRPLGKTWHVEKATVLSFVAPVLTQTGTAAKL